MNAHPARVICGIVNCRERPPWATIRRRAAEGVPLSELMSSYNVTRPELMQELRGVLLPSPLSTPAADATPAPPPQDASLDQTPKRQRRRPGGRQRSTNRSLERLEEVRALLAHDRVSWPEAAWLCALGVRALRKIAADNDWIAAPKIRRRATEQEGRLLLKVLAGEVKAAQAAEELRIPVEVMVKRVKSV